MKEKFKEGDVVESGGTIITVTGNNAGHYLGCFKGVVIHDEDKRDDRKIGMISDMWVTDSFTKIEPQHSFDQYFKEKEAKTQKIKSSNMFKEGNIVYNKNIAILVTKDQDINSTTFSGTIISVLEKGLALIVNPKSRNNWNSDAFKLLSIDLSKYLVDEIAKVPEFTKGDIVVNNTKTIHVLVTGPTKSKDSFAGTVIRELKETSGSHHKLGTYSDGWVTSSFTKVEDEIQIKP